MTLIHRMFDKIADRFISAYLTKADAKDLHPQRILLEQAQEEAAAYAQQHMPAAVIFKNQQEVLAHALKQAEKEGLMLEFGVASGDSIRFIASQTSQHVHGFDSFEGLPEDWGGRHESKGHYSTAGKLPTVPANVFLHKGWFENSLPGFLDKNQGLVSFLHIDCDLYSSTKTVLNLLAPRIVKGTIIVFDEYFNYISWREHEFKAFQEFVSKNKLRYSYLSWGYQQVVVRIEG